MVAIQRTADRGPAPRVWPLTAFSAMALLAVTGCGFVPTSQLTAAQSQNRTLTEENKSQLAEIENLKFHARSVENQLIRSEQDLAQLQQHPGAQRQVADGGRPHDRFTGLTRPVSDVPAGLSSRLTELSRRYPSLQYDAKTGVSKLDTDVVFDSGDDRLKPDAERLLTEFAQVFQSAEAKDLKIMVVGHTDNQKIARKEVRERFHDNWQLSTARALSVADFLRHSGIHDDRMGVAGFGGQQPIAPNTTAEDRRRNRRVEIFVVGADTPIVGWTESMTSAYRR